MKSRKLATLTFLAATLCLTGRAEAGGIAVSVLPQPQAPIQISKCSAAVNFNEYVGRLFTSSLNWSIEFKNTAKESAVSVQFRVKLSNAYGELLDNVVTQATGHFATDVSITGNHWSESDTWPGMGEVQCSVRRVLFSDGSAWNEPESPGVGTSPPTPNPSATT
jgi:hypothetical protein